MYSLFVFMFVHAIHTQLASARTMFFENQPVEEVLEEIAEPVAETLDNSQEWITESSAKPLTLKDHVQIMQNVGGDVGIDWRMLYAISEQESSFGKHLSGDNGKSAGWYHIYHVNTCEYRLTDKCINADDRLDFEKATYWTAKRLKRHESLGLFEMARSHNGLVSNHSNDWYAENILTIMKDAEMEVATL